MTCPKCSKEVWDNRKKKASGEFKANAPDFACKDKGCGWNSYPPKDAAPVQGYAQVPQQTQPAPFVPGVGRDAEIVALYWNSLDAILAGVAQKRLTDLFKSDDLVAMTATLFIQRAKA